MNLSLKNLKGKWDTTLVALFSESAGRMVVTVSPKNQKAFEKIMTGTATSLIGTVTSKPSLVIHGKQKEVAVNLSLVEMHTAYFSAFPENAALKKPAPKFAKKIMTSLPRALVLTGYGINCEEETAFAFEKAGGQATICHINDLIEKPSLLQQAEILAIPGGFSFGDDTG